MTWLFITMVICIFFIVLLQSVLMIAASEYISNTEAFFENKKTNYIRFIKLNFKKLIKSIYARKQNQISLLNFLANYVMLLLLIIPFVVFVYDTLLVQNGLPKVFFNNISKYYTVYAALVVFCTRIISYITTNHEIDLNKMVLKGFVSFALVLLNFGFVSFFVDKIDGLGTYKLVLKILLFFNTVIAIYIFDNFTKHKKKKALYQFKIVDKVTLYFMLMGIFFMLNIGEALLVKFFYYSISIYLIDFLAAYTNKTIGFIKMEQTIKVSYEYTFIYYLVFYICLMVAYGL